MRTLLSSISLLLALPLAAATVTVTTQPAGDGVLIDSTGDGIVNQAMSLQADGPDREAVTGKIWRQNRKAVFEFQLPELATPIKKATLRLSPNGKFGCHPEKEDAHGPETDLYFYLAPEADGKIELTDDTGEKIGRVMEAKPAERKLNSALPVSFDVTEAVKKAAAAKSGWIGFRLEAAENAPTGIAWRWRTSEFAAASGKQHAPQLIIVTE